ncbi:phosphoribosylformylglycinamidine synthase, purS protein [Aliarcobacter cryaerophilus]|uniref:Phosphoribosylformylglycinamidine synthase subunit PurS n=1 Tax=Aliarcobacter cryaerophilus TaxID=28198 RepID=A0A1V9VD49_9BACT|nr:phosphoribosylformylglycinamidine synthase, purS protein [Aliarcobacter cryaerophilus]
MKAIVNVGLKKGVLDDQGKAINLSDVRVGKQIIIELNSNDKEKAKEEVTKMCEKLLANTVIEDYTIEIVG